MELYNSLNQKEREKEGKENTPSTLRTDSQLIKIASFISKDKGIDGNKK